MGIKMRYRVGGNITIPPTLPLMFNTGYAAPAGSTITVGNSGRDYNGSTALQDAVDAAARGDKIVVDVDYTYTGPLRLKQKSGTGWIYLISASLSSLTEGKRVQPADVTYMPSITSLDDANSTPAVFTTSTTGAAPSHYRICGFCVKSLRTAYQAYNLIAVGYKFPTEVSSWTNYTSLEAESEIPSYIWFDRCYIYSDEAKYARCGVMFYYVNYGAVIDSYLAGFNDGSSDSQGINVIGGNGPLKIDNNYIEAAGENFMAGGTDPSITNSIPSDIQFTRNYCYKKEAWFAVGGGLTKNHFELKNAERVLCQGNWLENIKKNSGGQNCTSIVLTVRNQSGGATWSRLRDLTIQYNRIRTCARGFRLTGYDDTYTSQQTQRVLIEHNCWDDMRTLNLCDPYQWQISQDDDGPALDVTIRNNVWAASGYVHVACFLSASDPAHRVAQNLILTNNIMLHGRYGLAGNNYFGSGSKIVFGRYAPDGLVVGPNLLIMRSVEDTDYEYHIDDFDATTPWLSKDTVEHPLLWGPHEVSAVQFTTYGEVDWDANDYTLAAGSPYKGQGSDGKDLGPDWPTLNVLTAHSKTGNWS